jgi:PAS domain S-box-containing protein
MTPNKKTHILIVDDDVRNIYSLEQMLSGPGRGFFKSTNGKEALKIALSKDLDLILLDVQMPQMSGIEVAQILKTNRRTRDVPILFVCADGDLPLQGPGQGAGEYLYRPLDPAVTEARVSALLLQSQQRKELAEKNAILEKYALLIDNSADLICTLDAATLVFEETNHAAKDILGYSRDEVKGTSLWFYLHEEDRHKVQKISREGEERFTFEARVWTAERRTRYLRWSVISRKGRWLANVRDMTGAQEAEEIRNYLVAVVKQSNDAIYLHDADGRVISWNKGAERIYGFSEKEALKMNIWNFVPEHLLAEAQAVVNAVLDGSPVQSVETTRITKRGEVRDVLFSASVLVDAESGLRSIAITERDITEEKRINNELTKALSEVREVNKELESFSYSVSHDLRAPLRALNGYSHILEEEFQHVLNDEGRRLLGNIRSNARRMGMLIDDLLAFSQMGRKEMQRSPVNMQDLAGEVVNELEGSMAHHALIEVQELPPTYGDRELLRQVWVNLISNAIKYSAKVLAPRITIGSPEQQKPGETGYFVQDNGVGFDMEYAGKLFGVFQRLHSNEEFEGTGVGLAIVQRIVSRHGGRVWAKGVRGEGATFYFTLPEPPARDL